MNKNKKKNNIEHKTKENRLESSVRIISVVILFIILILNLQELISFFK